ncbi:hypothetical protein BH10ACT3_BH10ACT3_16110 [soil metagenome]
MIRDAGSRHPEVVSQVSRVCGSVEQRDEDAPASFIGQSGTHSGKSAEVNLGGEHPRMVHAGMNSVKHELRSERSDVSNDDGSWTPGTPPPARRPRRRSAQNPPGGVRRFVGTLMVVAVSLAVAAYLVFRILTSGDTDGRVDAGTGSEVQREIVRLDD